MSPIPMPPYRSSTVMPNRSAFRSASQEPCGNSSVSSQCRAFGASSRSATSRARARSACWSSVSANGSAPSVVTGREASGTSRNLTTVSANASTSGRSRWSVPVPPQPRQGSTGVTQDAPVFEYEEIDFVTGQPYEQWGRAREVCPVIKTDGSMMGTPERSSYQITRWDDVESVLRDGADVLVDDQRRAHRQFMGELILAMDGKEHRSYRNLVAHAFRASQLEQWGETAIEPAINESIDAIAAARSRRPGPRHHESVPGARDLRDRRRPDRGQPAVPPMVRADQHRSAQPRGRHGGVACDAGIPRAPRCRPRRDNPQGDLLSDLVHAEIDGQRLTDEKIYGFLRLLLPAGAETTFRVMGNALTALLTQLRRDGACACGS